MKIIAHRGLWRKYEEQNTFIAFKRALDLGFGIELDIRDYKGNLVIGHDMAERNSPRLYKVFTRLSCLVKIPLLNKLIKLVFNKLVKNSRIYQIIIKSS